MKKKADKKITPSNPIYIYYLFDKMKNDKTTIQNNTARKQNLFPIH